MPLLREGGYITRPTTTRTSSPTRDQITTALSSLHRQFQPDSGDFAVRTPTPTPTGTQQPPAAGTPTSGTIQGTAGAAATPVTTAPSPVALPPPKTDPRLQPTEPSQPIEPPPAEPVGGVDPAAQLRNLTETELGALLDGIAARYNLTREQLAAQEGQLGLAARSIEAQLQSARTQAVRGAQSAASERGILRSGIHARNVSNIDTAIAAQAQQAAAGRQTSQDAISAALARMEQQIAQEQAAARQQAESGLLQFEQGQTVADLLASLPLAPTATPGPLLPAAPILGNPLLPSQPGNAALFGASNYTPLGAVNPFGSPSTVLGPQGTPTSPSGVVGLDDIEAYLRSRGIV